MEHTANMIEVTGLKKSYGETQAVKGIDFYVESGKLFAFLGPNGAGKSTTMDIICTFLKADEGQVSVDGYPLQSEDAAIRRVIGAVFQDGVLDNLLSIEENLKTRGGFYGLRGKELEQAIERAAQITGVTELMKRPYGKLSGGQRRRCDIARALVHIPKVLFLDEPTTGLDPQTRKSVWEAIRTLQKETGMTVFMTTHYMEEAAGADYVVIIDDGLIVAKGTPADLKARYATDKLRLVCEDEPKQGEAEERLKSHELTYTVSGRELSVPLQTSKEALPLLAELDSLITSFEVTRGTMDDVFIAVTGKEIRE